MMAKAQAVWKCKDQRIIHHAQAPNSSENEMNVDVKQTKPQRVDKKRRRERIKDERAAYAAHTTMCKKALVMMDKIGSLITKLDSSDSD